MTPRLARWLWLGFGVLAGCGDARLELPPPLHLLAIAPHHGATAVSTSTSVELTFDAELDEAALADTAVRLLADGSAVPCRRALQADGTALLLVPDQVLAADTAHEIVVLGSLRGVDTSMLGDEHRARFRTRP